MTLSFACAQGRTESKGSRTLQYIDIRNSLHASAMKPFTPSDIAPILACFLALVRFLIPIREVLAVRRGGNLGVSPFPVAWRKNMYDHPSIL